MREDIELRDAEKKKKKKEKVGAGKVRNETRNQTGIEAKGERKVRIQS